MVEQPYIMDLKKGYFLDNFELFIFDFDGTLCATHEAICHCIQKTFERYGVSVPPNEKIEWTIGTGIGLSETIFHFNPNLNAEEIEKWVITYRDIYNSGEGKDRTFLFDGVFETLKSLFEAREASIVLVSNKGEKAVKLAIDHFKLTPYITLVVCDTKGIEKKPKPDSYENIIRPKFSHVSRDKTLVIGDTQADILFAQNIGATSCWAAYGYGDRNKCASLRPDLTIHSLYELQVLLGLSGIS
jgi:phosphoglycolate phosphatase